MIRAMSSYVAVRQRLHPGLLDTLAKGGAQAIELFCAKGHFDYTDRAQVRELAQWFNANGVTANSLHSPLFSDDDWGRSGGMMINVAGTEKRDHIASMDEIKRALEVAEVLPYKYLVQHIGAPNEEFSDKKFDATMTAIEHLRAFAKPLGVTLLVENIPNELSSPQRLMELLNAAHFDDVHVCFDVGHAHIVNRVDTDFAPLRDRIRSTHVHDNLKDRDSHLWPGAGSIAWKETMELLQSAPNRPPLLLEIDGQDGQDLVKEMRSAFERLAAATDPVNR